MRKSLYGSEVNGRFHYTVDGSLSALDKFERLQPYRYYREVPLVADPTVRGEIINAGLYGQLHTRLAPGMDFTGGLRLDAAHYPSSPLNEVVLSELGLRTDNKIKSFVVQPRVQLTWDVNNLGRDVVRFGAGVFCVRHQQLHGYQQPDFRRKTPGDGRCPEPEPANA